VWPDRNDDLCGKTFRVGGVTCEGIELCEPCSLFAKRTRREVLKFFLSRGGLRARIVVDPDSAFGMLSRARGVAVPDTDAQAAWVRDFVRGLPGQ
jgi:hypothetical protein